MNSPTLAKLRKLIEPLNQTWGEYQARLTMLTDESGYIDFLLNWKTQKYQVEFATLGDAITKTEEIIKDLNPPLKEVWEDWNGKREMLPSAEVHRTILESCGVIFEEAVPDDPDWIYCKLPDGWTRRWIDNSHDYLFNKDNQKIGEIIVHENQKPELILSRT